MFCVSRMEGRKRKRTYFKTRREAEVEQAALLDQLKATGETWMSLSAQERSELAGVIHEMKDRGLAPRAVWEAYKQGTSNSGDKSVTLETAVNETVAAKIEARRRPRYVDSLKEYLGKFAEGRKMLQVDQITAAEIEKWFSTRKEAPSTRASNLGRLSSMFDLCFRRGYIQFNPCDRVERVTVETARPVIFSADETRKLVETCAETDKAFLPYIVIGVFTGIRPEECEKLKWPDVDPKVMKAHPKPIGEISRHPLDPEPNDRELNDIHLQATRFACGLTIAAWGNHGTHLDGDKRVLQFLTGLKCFKITNEGQPQHPLYVPYSTALIDYTPTVSKERIAPRGI